MKTEVVTVVVAATAEVATVEVMAEEVVEATKTGMVDHRPMTIAVVMVGTSEEVMEAAMVVVEEAGTPLLDTMTVLLPTVVEDMAAMLEEEGIVTLTKTDMGEDMVEEGMKGTSFVV